MADQILRIKDSIGNVHDLAFPVIGTDDYGLLTVARTPDSNNVFGEVIGVVSGNTANVITYTAPAGYRVRGFNATGDGDGYFALKVNGVTALSARIHIMEKTIGATLYLADAVSLGDIITLSVKNESDTICSYEATLIGE